MDRLLAISDTIAAILGKIGAAVGWLFLVATVVIIFDVLSRKFGYQIPGMGSTRLQELEWHLHAALFSFWIGVGYVRNTHVRIDVADRVRFLGWVPAAEVPRYHRLADAFVLPTLQDNWSLAVVEAMASGLPIVTSPYNGLWPELVHEGENGFVVQPENVADLADRLSLFAKLTAAERARLGARSAELVKRCRPERAAAAFSKAIRVALAA